MSAARESVTVRVPGSTSNCGAGFDTLGLALTIYNRVTLTRTRGVAAPQPERPSDARATELVALAAERFFAAAGIAPHRFRFRIEGEVPPARGLGSSATILVGVLAGLDELHGTKWSAEQLAALGTAIEGNPENICAGIFGGFTVTRCAPTAADYRDTIRAAVPPEIVFVVASPAIEMKTTESRGVLPATLPLADAARSVNSAAMVTAAFLTGDFEKLRHAAGDFLHEPYRLPRIPGAREAIAGGVAAGALTGWLSGSGSSVLCVARPPQANAVVTAMRGAFVRASVPCEVRVLAADNDGLRMG
jgi:homoserine kinase